MASTHQVPQPDGRQYIQSRVILQQKGLLCSERPSSIRQGQKGTMEVYQRQGIRTRLCCLQEYEALQTAVWNDPKQSNPMLSNKEKIPYYMIGDSAYALWQFLLTPYDNAKPNTAEDIFNYHLLSSRINVECTFGDIDVCWGIFWRPLKFPLQQHKFIID